MDLASQWRDALRELGHEGHRQRGPDVPLRVVVLRCLDGWWREHGRPPSGRELAGYISEREPEVRCGPGSLRPTLHDLAGDGLACAVKRGRWVPVSAERAEEYIREHGQSADLRSVSERVLDTRREMEAELGRHPEGPEVAQRAGVPLSTVYSTYRAAMARGELVAVERGVYRDA